MADDVPRPYPAPVPDGLSPGDELVEYACLTFHPDDGVRRRRRAERLAGLSPGLAGESFFAAVVLGDVAAVRRALAADAGVAARAGGPRGWVPLLYLCFGRVLGQVETPSRWRVSCSRPGPMPTATCASTTSTAGAPSPARSGRGSRAPSRRRRTRRRGRSSSCCSTQAPTPTTRRRSTTRTSAGTARGSSSSCRAGSGRRAG
jgi:hypothetical protein